MDVVAAATTTVDYKEVMAHEGMSSTLHLPILIATL